MDWFLPIQAVDGLVKSTIPPMARVILWSGAAGALSMAIYAAASPQEKLKKIGQESRDKMKQLAKHTGEFKELIKLQKETFALAFNRIWLTLPSTFAAIAPALYVLIWMEEAFEKDVFITSGPWWVQGWMFPAFVSLLVVSLAIKRIFKIE